VLLVLEQQLLVLLMLLLLPLSLRAATGDVALRVSAVSAVCFP